MKNENIRNKAGRFGAILLACALPALAQVNPWQKVDLGGPVIWQDPEWKSGFPSRTLSSVRLAADGSGRLYLSNGASLLIGTESGTKWRAYEQAPSGGTLYERRPLGAGGAGTVLWGSWSSADGGVTWGTAPGFSSAFAVHPNGPTLAGTGIDGIDRSSGPSQAWTHVHSGSTFGQVREFAVGTSGYMFALPGLDQLLYSTDTGKVWKEWKVAGLNEPLSGGNVRAMTVDSRSGNPIWLAVDPSGNAKGNALLRMYVFFPVVDTIRTTLPDSTISCLHVGSDGALWAGTRGQGLWVSRDNGKTFAASNSGLGGLFIESIGETSDNRLYVLTREGLYRSTVSTALRPLAFRTVHRGDKASLHLPGITRYQPVSGSARISVLADGRMLIMPQENSSINNPSPTR